jgi:hypothetical protein
MPQAKLRIPVATSEVQTITTGAAERIRDGEVQTTPDGETKWRCHIIATFPGNPQPQHWPVDVVGDPGPLPLGAPVRCVKLMVSPWEMPDSQNAGRTVYGLSFTAERVEVNQAPPNGHRTPVAEPKEAAKP